MVVAVVCVLVVVAEGRRWTDDGRTTDAVTCTWALVAERMAAGNMKT